MARSKNTLSMLSKRRQQLTRQLVVEMMDVKVSGSNASPGLLSKLMLKLDKDLESEDPEIRHKTMDKIIKLIPFVIIKEKAPMVQLNVQNNNQHISAGKSTTLAIEGINKYLKERGEKMNRVTQSQIEDAEVIEPVSKPAIEVKKTNKKIEIDIGESDFEDEEDED